MDKILILIKKVIAVLKHLKKYILYPKINLNFKRNDLNQMAIVLMGEPEYNNLGDHAIAYATQRFIEDNFRGIEYISITENDLKYNMKNVSKIINSQDILLLQGGGNMGDLYPDQVLLRKKIIENFDNQIVLMPQTIYYAKSEAKLPNYYNDNCNRITLVAREKVSYDIMKELYLGKVVLSPDIVLYLSNEDNKVTSNRSGVLVCLRDDQEKARECVSRENVVSILKELDVNYKFFSTVVNESIKSQDREVYLKSLFEEFYNAELIITDRLHAMIIAAVTETPCLVMPTINHKVTKSYSWIENFNYIKILNRPEQLRDIIVTLINIDDKSKEYIKEHFEKLYSAIYEKVKG